MKQIVLLLLAVVLIVILVKHLYYLQNFLILPLILLVHESCI